MHHTETLRSIRAPDLPRQIIQDRLISSIYFPRVAVDEAVLATQAYKFKYVKSHEVDDRTSFHEPPSAERYRQKGGDAGNH